MANNTLNIGNAEYSDLTNRVDNLTVATKDTDGASGIKETIWQNYNWAQYWGYFNAIPDLKSAILMKAVWIVGKGYKADPETKVILDHIHGWGKDTFEDILFSMEVVKRVGGDAYAEIIRDPETDLIVNLKPLDPGTMQIVCNASGIITEYRQVSKTANSKREVKYKPKDILHLSNNRLADQIHGISDIESMESTILAEYESFTDAAKVMHRQAKPLIMFKLGTDDAAKISAFIKKMDEATAKGENIYIPDDADSVSYEVVQINPSALIMEWRNDIRNKFYRTIGLPQIVASAGGNSTESESKVIYLAFENLVAKDQLFLEKQIWAQLFFKIKLNPPTSMMENLNTDEKKDANQQLGFMPSENSVGAL